MSSSSEVVFATLSEKAKGKSVAQRDRGLLNSSYDVVLATLGITIMSGTAFLEKIVVFSSLLSARRLYEATCSTSGGCTKARRSTSTTPNLRSGGCD